MKKQNKSVFKRIVLSYLIIILIPIILTSTVQISTLSTVRQGTIDESVVALNMLKGELDKSFTQLQNLSYSVALSNETGYFENSARGIARYTSFLKTQRRIYGDIENFAVYFKNCDMIISSTGYWTDMRDYYDVYYSSTDLTYDDFCATVAESRSAKYMFLKDQKRSESGLTYIFPSVFDNAGDVCVIASIPSDRYARLVSKLEKELNSKIIIINKSNEYYVGGSELGNIDFKSLNAENGIETAKIDGKDTVLCYVASEITGWKYISIKEESIFWSKMRFIKALWFASMAICVLLGCVMIIVFSRQSFTPIKTIADKLDGYVRENNEKNEFARIEYAINSISEKYNDTQSYLKSQEKNLKNACLYKLLKNETKITAQLKDELARFNITFPYGKFAVLAAQAKDTETLFGNDGEQLDSLERRVLTDLILSNILTELTEPCGIAVSAYVDNSTVIIINTEKSGEEIKQRITEAAARVQKIAAEEFSIDIIVAAGTLKESALDISAAYFEAEKAMLAAQMADSTSAAVFYDEMSDIAETASYPLKEQQLINALRAGDSAQCRNIIEEMLKLNGESITSPATVKCRGYETAAVIMRAFNDLNLSKEKTVLYPLADKIEKGKTYSDIVNALTEMAGAACAEIERVCLSDGGIFAKAKTVIRENYGNVNLCVNFISDRLSISANYLSRAFKEQTGENLLDYMRRVRIDAAKELLENSNMTIEKISEETGFSNSNSFQRVFKKTEGVTPGSFRKMKQHQ